MAEQTCINYLNKVNEIQTLCGDYNCTKTQLETKIGELETLETQFENELGTMNIPVVMSHMDVYILARIEMCRKATLHESLLKLSEVRIARTEALDKVSDYETVTLPYFNENKTIDDYVETVVNSCNCMRERKNIIKKKGKPN